MFFDGSLDGCFCSFWVLDERNCLRIIRSNAIIIPAATPAEVPPIMNQACHAGRKVCRYRNEPMRKNKEAEPTNVVISAIKTAVAMLKISNRLRRCFRASSVS